MCEKLFSQIEVLVNYSFVFVSLRKMKIPSDPKMWDQSDYWYVSFLFFFSLLLVLKC